VKGAVSSWRDRGGNGRRCYLNEEFRDKFAQVVSGRQRKRQPAEKTGGKSTKHRGGNNRGAMGSGGFLVEVFHHEGKRGPKIRGEPGEREGEVELPQNEIRLKGSH